MVGHGTYCLPLWHDGSSFSHLGCHSFVVVMQFVIPGVIDGVLIVLFSLCNFYWRVY